MSLNILGPVENLRWFGHQDLLVVHAPYYVNRTFRVQQPHLVQSMGFIMDGLITMPWGNVLNALPFLRCVYVIAAIDDHLWTTRDLDNSYLGRAVFEEQFVGAAQGVPGMARVGRILLNGGDITDQQHPSLPLAAADLQQWLAVNWTPALPGPDPAVECRALFGNIEERFRTRRRETHPRYAEDAGFH